MRRFIVAGFVASLVGLVFLAPRPASALPANAALSYGHAQEATVQDVGHRYYRRRYAYRPYRYRYRYAYRPYPYYRPYYRPYSYSYYGYGYPYYRRPGFSFYFGW